MRIRITFKQNFRGRIVEDSYVRTVKDYEEIQKIEDDLYIDPLVFSVEWEEVTE